MSEWPSTPYPRGSRDSLEARLVRVFRKMWSRAAPPDSPNQHNNYNISNNNAKEPKVNTQPQKTSPKESKKFAQETQQTKKKSDRNQPNNKKNNKNSPPDDCAAAGAQNESSGSTPARSPASPPHRPPQPSPRPNPPEPTQTTTQHQPSASAQSQPQPTQVLTSDPNFTKTSQNPPNSQTPFFLLPPFRPQAQTRALTHPFWSATETAGK